MKSSLLRYGFDEPTLGKFEANNEIAGLADYGSPLEVGNESDHLSFWYTGIKDRPKA